MKIRLAWDRTEERFGVLRVPFAGAEPLDPAWRRTFRASVARQRRAAPPNGAFGSITFYAEGIAVTAVPKRSRDVVRLVLEEAVARANQSSSESPA